MKIDPNSLKFSFLTESSDVSSFACSEYKDLEDFLKHDAKNYLREKIAITYLVHYEGQLVGFFSLAMGCIASDSVKKWMGVVKFSPSKYPAHLLARLATNDGFRGKGIGKEMLKRVYTITFKACSSIGCRFIVVDAKKTPKTINFYEKYGGFVKIHENEDTVKMIIDINKLEDPDTSIETQMSDYE